MKLVLEFTKTGNLIYISHLDLSRLFLRVFRMAGIRPSYSCGFNPHPRMSFTMPLPLGLHSICELLEFETDEIKDPAEIPQAVKRVNERLPEGARVVSWYEKPDSVRKSLASYVSSASYEFMCEGIMNAPALLEAFFKRDSVIVKKYDKQKGREVDKEVRSEMLSYSIIKDIRGRMLAEATLSAKPGQTLNPLVFFRAFCEAAACAEGALTPIITRTAIQKIDGKAIIELLK